MHEIMQVMFPRDEDGFELYSDMQAEMMPGPGRWADPEAGPVPGGDPNNPLAAMESLLLDNESSASTRCTARYDRAASVGLERVERP